MVVAAIIIIIIIIIKTELQRTLQKLLALISNVKQLLILKSYGCESLFWEWSRIPNTSEQRQKLCSIAIIV
jgi:hypothetical protein